MMPDTATRTGPAPAPRRGVPSTHRPTPAHTPARDLHTIHTSVTGTPGSARPGVDGPPRPDLSVHTVAFLVHMARWVAPPAGGALLICAGVYAGPWSLVPVPVLLALAAVGFAVRTAPAGGVR